MLLSIITRLIVGVAYVIPESIYMLVATAFARITYWSNNQTTRVVKRNLQLCFPEETEQRRNRIALEYLKLNFYMTKEAAYAWLGNEAFIRSKFIQHSGAELINRGDGRPTIIAVPHIGNWEFFWHWLQLNFDAISMYSPAKIKPLNRLMLTARQKFGGRPFDTSAKSIMKMLKALRQQGVMMILPDQAPRLNSGIYSPFFGHPAYTMTLLHRFIQKTDSKLLFGTCLRDSSNQGFNISITEPDFDSRSLCLEDFNQSLNKQLEQLITISPEQYLWGYKRFKRQPAGKELYLDEIKRREKRQAKAKKDSP